MAKNRYKSGKKLLLTGVGLLVLAGGILFGLESTNVIDLYKSRPNSPVVQTDAEKVSGVDYNPATSTDNEDINAKKEAGTVGQAPTVPTNDTSIQITFIANAQDTSGGQLEVRTLLNGVTDGTCALTLTKGSSTIAKSSNVVRQNTSFLCEAFIIPYSELSNGDWQIKLKVTSGDGRTNEASTSTTIN